MWRNRRWAGVLPRRVSTLGPHVGFRGTSGSVREDLREVVADDLLELVIGARLRGAIGTPALELRGVPQPRPLHVVVTNLDHEYGVDRDPGQILLRVPARNSSRQAAELVRLRLCPLTPR